MSDYYDHTTFPQTGTVGSSAQMRAELELIEAGFNKLPDLVGNALKLVRINASGTAQEAVLNTTLQAADIVAATAKATPVNADMIPIVDSAAGNAFKKITWADLLGTLDSTFLKSGDTAAALTITTATINGGTISGITDLSIADGGTGASTAATARSNLGLGTISTQAANNVAITGGTVNGTSVGATTPSTGSFTSLTDSGNLTFTGTGNRITGDFSNATLSNRVSVQTSTVNGNTSLATLPNGTSQISNVRAFNNSDPTNAALIDIAATSTDNRLSSSITGTGTYLPMTFYTGGSERMRIDTSGNVGIGTSSPSAASGFTFLTVQNNTNGAVVQAKNSVVDLRLQADGTEGYIGNLTNHPIVFWTNATERMRIDTSGNVLVTNAAGLGYGTGAGGTVTQATSKSTAVTLNKPTGEITMNNAALAAATTVFFNVNNSIFGANDTVAVSVVNNANYTAQQYFGVGGQFGIRVTNHTAGSLSEAVKIQFAIIKGATS